MKRMANKSKVFAFTACGFLFLVAFQNCTSANPVFSGSGSFFQSTGNGGSYDDKPSPGHYYREIPGYKCNGQDRIYAELEVTENAATKTTLDPASCGPVRVDVPESSLRHSNFNSALIGVDEGVYRRSETPPDPANIPTVVETWCRSLTDSRYDIVVEEEASTRTVRANVISIDGSSQPVTDTRVVSRELQNRTLSYKGSGLDLSLSLSGGVLKGRMVGQVQGRSVASDLDCRSSGRLDEQAPVAPTMALDFSTSAWPSFLTFTRNSPASYFDVGGILRKVGAGQPRVEFAKGSTEALGLLIENASANHLVWSEDFARTEWQATLTQMPNIQSDAGVAPDGTMTADRVVNPPVLTESVIQQRTGDLGNVGGRTFTFSIWVKGVITGSRAVMLTVSDTSANWNWNFVLGPDIRGTYNEWTRLSVTGAIGTKAPSNQAQATLGCGYGACVLDMTGSDFLIWGAQLEEQSTPTSYIATTAQPETRDADSAQFANLNWFQGNQGSFLMTASRPVVEIAKAGQTPSLISLADGSNQRYTVDFDPASGLRATLTGSTWSASNVIATLYRAALGFSPGEALFAVNGASASAPTNVQTGLVPIDSSLGGATAADKWQGYIRNVIYYPTRLPNEELQKFAQ